MGAGRRTVRTPAVGAGYRRGDCCVTGGKAWKLWRRPDRSARSAQSRRRVGRVHRRDPQRCGGVRPLLSTPIRPVEQLLFRSLGLSPGPEIDAYAAAALLDTDPGSADLLVQRLADQSLLTGVSPGRYHLHDLIRAHARTLGAAHDPEPERTTALDRLLDYYAHTAQRASIPIARLPRPAAGRTGLPRQRPRPARSSEATARAWLRAEYPNLEAAFTHADTRAADRHHRRPGRGTGRTPVRRGSVEPRDRDPPGRCRGGQAPERTRRPRRRPEQPGPGPRSGRRPSRSGRRPDAGPGDLPEDRRPPRRSHRPEQSGPGAVADRGP